MVAERGNCGPADGGTRSPGREWTEWGVGQGAIQAPEHDSGWEAEVLE